MPSYDLKCDDCGKTFEVFLLHMLRDTDKVCPECGSEQVTQRISGGYFNKSSSSAPPCGASSCPASDGGFG